MKATVVSLAAAARVFRGLEKAYAGHGDLPPSNFRVVLVTEEVVG